MVNVPDLDSDVKSHGVSLGRWYTNGDLNDGLELHIKLCLFFEEGRDSHSKNSWNLWSSQLLIQKMGWSTNMNIISMDELRWQTTVFTVFFCQSQTTNQNLPSVERCSHHPGPCWWWWLSSHQWLMDVDGCYLLLPLPVVTTWISTI